MQRRMMREVATLAWPAMLQGLVATVVLFTDRLFLGRYSTEALGSLSISSVLVWSVFNLFSAYGAGVLAIIGRRIGAGDNATARATLRAVLLLAGAIGTVVAVLGFSLRWPIAETLAGGRTSHEVRLMATQYMAIVFACAPLEFMATAGSTALQASGDTRTPMIIGAITGLVNLVLSWVLVYGHAGMPELGVRGAAIGTAVAFSMQGLLVLLALRFRAGGFSLARRAADLRLSLRSILAPVMRVSSRSFGERILFHSAYIGFTALIGHLGDVSMAAHQSLFAIEAISFVAADGLGVAAGALVAQKLGAGRTDEAALAARLAARVGAVVLGVIGLIFLVIPELCLRILTDDAEVIALGASCLRVAAIAQPMMALTQTYSGALRGAGDTTSPMWAALIGPVMVRLLACYVFAYPLGLGLLGIWMGSTLDWLVRTAFLVRIFRAGRWQNIDIS
jgi:putative MATE family efflux protein